MDQYRRPQEFVSSGTNKDHHQQVHQHHQQVHHHHHEDPRSSSSSFMPPSIIRPESSSSSAFSKPILPSSSSLLSPGPPKPPLFTTNGSSTDPLTPSPRYRECLRNHAASLGGHVIDGCGEFMPAGPSDPLKCAACGCHRSFHRRDPHYDPAYRAAPAAPLMLPPPPAPIRFSGNTTDQSSSEEKNNDNTTVMNNTNTSDEYRNYGQAMVSSSGEGGRKKRFRTKFSGEQKEKMKAFAERVGWRVQKKDEGEMERFCAEVGISRQVLKVWMHNNKHLLVKKPDQGSSDGGGAGTGGAGGDDHQGQNQLELMEHGA